MSEEMVNRVARAIAEGLGDDFDDAFETKSEWNAARGEKGGRYRDVNEPRQSGYMEAARAAIAAMQEGDPGIPVYRLHDATDDVLGGGAQRDGEV